MLTTRKEEVAPQVEVEINGGDHGGREFFKVIESCLSKDMD